MMIPARSLLIAESVHGKCKQRLSRIHIRLILAILIICYCWVNVHSLVIPKSRFAATSRASISRTMSKLIGSSFIPSSSALRNIQRSKSALLSSSVPSRTKSGLLSPELRGKINSVFDMSTKQTFSIENISAWESQVNAIIEELQLLSSDKAILDAYTLALELCTAELIDPFQIATFELLVNGVVKILLGRVRGGDEDLTEVVDLITDTHLAFVEVFSKSLMVDEESDDAEFKEQLGYQFAGLIRILYQRLNNALGSQYDKSKATADLRVENWASPVYARLQRRVIRFSTSFVDEKLEELKENSFDRLMNRISTQVSTRYPLASSTINNISRHPIDGASDGSDNDKSQSASGYSYAPWSTADLIVTVLRNTMAGVDLPSLEAKILQRLQNDIANRMQPRMRPMERLVASKPTTYNEKELLVCEDMLNMGHDTVAAVLALWHVRYNIVGVLVTDEEEGVKDSYRVKDYLRPMVIPTKRESLLESIPKAMHFEVESTVNELIERVGAESVDMDLEAASILAHAVRNTATVDYRALSILNSNPDDWPESRDAIFVSIFACMLTNALVAPNLDRQVFLENLVALAALGEAVGVREPRKACADAFMQGLRNAAVALQRAKRLGSDEASNLMLSKRVQMIELSLTMIMQLEEGVGRVMRLKAFKSGVETILSEGERRGEQSTFKELEAAYPTLAQLLGVPQEQAASIVVPMGESKFDRTVGSMLLNADLAISMPEMGPSFREQLINLGATVSIGAEQAEIRIGLLAGTAFMAMVEAALEEGRNMNLDRSEMIFKKAYNIYRHPLLLELQRLQGRNLQDVAVQMIVLQYDKYVIVEMMRLIETLRQNIAATGSADTKGWSAGQQGQSTDPQFVAFLTALQAQLMKEYTSKL